MLYEEPTYVDDLRFALGVMEEYSHLGLDSDRALQLRGIMQDQNDKAEKVRKLIVARVIAIDSESDE
jgi:hypothetical protein